MKAAVAWLVEQQMHCVVIATDSTSILCKFFESILHSNSQVTWMCCHGHAGAGGSERTGWPSEKTSTQDVAETGQGGQTEGCCRQTW